MTDLFDQFQDIYEGYFASRIVTKTASQSSITMARELWLGELLQRIDPARLKELVSGFAKSRARSKSFGKPMLADFVNYAESVGFIVHQQEVVKACPLCNSTGYMWLPVSVVADDEGKRHNHIGLFDKAVAICMARVAGCTCDAGKDVKSRNAWWVDQGARWHGETSAQVPEFRFPDGELMDDSEGWLNYGYWEAGVRIWQKANQSPKGKAVPVKQVNESKRADGRGLKAIGTTKEVTRAKEVGAMPVVPDSDSAGKDGDGAGAGVPSVQKSGGGDDLKVTLCEICGKPAAQGQRWCDETCKACAEQEVIF